MYFTNEEPRPKSSRKYGLIKILRTIQVPKSCTPRCLMMYGVRRRVTRKLQHRPSRLKNVLVTSFFEKSPSSVTSPLIAGMFWDLLSQTRVHAGLESEGSHARLARDRRRAHSGYTPEKNGIEQPNNNVDPRRAKPGRFRDAVPNGKW